MGQRQDLRTALNMQLQVQNRNNAAGERRNDAILEALRSRGEMTVQEIADSTNYSKSTIQRGLEQLRDTNQLYWLKGGVVTIKTHNADESSVDLNPAAEITVPETALQMIKEDRAVILDASPFSIALVSRIDKNYKGTIITHSPRVAAALLGHSSAKVHLIGGKLQNGATIPNDRDIRFLEQVAADPCIIGCCNVDLVDVTVSDADDLEIKQAMIAHARSVVVAASNADLDKKSNFILASLAKITHLVLQDEVPTTKIKKYEKAGLTIVKIENPSVSP